ncbi:MAG: Rho termination factor N-terminal domain-containing protein, partial [Lapillicoccus sp.]
MTDTTDLAAPAETSGKAVRSGRSGLSAMNVADLKGLAGQLGIRGTTKMRKDDLVAAIAAHQSGQRPARDERSAPPGGPSPEPASS